MQKVISIFLLFFVISCSAKKPEESNQANALKLYNKAIKNIEKKNFYSATLNLEDLENKYPYSNLVAKSEVINGFLNYVLEDYDGSFTIAEKFLKLRPANKNAEYMYYLRAASLYQLMSDENRSQNKAMEARRALREIIVRFPNSRYVDDSALKLQKINDLIALHELAVARFYLKNKEYLPAIKTLNDLISTYPTSKHIAEARYRLVETYITLGLYNQSLAENKKLQKKYPKSKWSNYAKDLIAKEI